MAEASEQIRCNAGEPTALEALTEREQRFRRLVETLPDAILVHSEGTIVYVNPFCLRLLAANRPEQLIGKDIYEIVEPSYLPAVSARIRTCYSTGTASAPMESVLIACDGSLVDVEAVAIPISWRGSHAIEVVLRDIRKRKRAEQAADEWQKRLELARKAGLRIGFWDWDVEADKVIWSDETYRQFGYTRQTFGGRIRDFSARIHPEDRPMVEEAVQKVLVGGADYAAQHRVVRPDGSTCWVAAQGVMIRNGSRHMTGI